MAVPQYMVVCRTYIATHGTGTRFCELKVKSLSVSLCLLLACLLACRALRQRATPLSLPLSLQFTHGLRRACKAPRTERRAPVVGFCEEV